MLAAEQEQTLQQSRIIVDAMWDDEAGVFVATSSDVPGLVTEADTWEHLQSKLAILVPEFLELNRGDGPALDGEAELIVLSEQRSKVRLHA